jgi:hypothetical protein
MPSLSKNWKKKTDKWYKKLTNLQVLLLITIGIKELDTGLSLPAQWNLASDSKAATEQPLQVARCNKIIKEGN